MKKYIRSSFEVEAVLYEKESGLEDGFLPWSSVITAGWVVADDLVRIERPDGSLVCPFIRNRRGLIFLREGDYIIKESDGEKHACGADKFFKRFTEM